MHRLKGHDLLENTQLKLRTVNGGKIKIAGIADVKFKIGKLYKKHPFYVTEGVSQNVILGRDFLVTNKVKLDFENTQLTIDQQTIRMEDDAYIASFVRLAQDVVLPPQTAAVCNTRLKHGGLEKTVSNISAIKTGFMEREPGLLVTNTIAENKNKKIPIQICNHTNRTFKLRKGNVVGKAERVNVSCIQSVNYPGPKTGGGEYESETARRKHDGGSEYLESVDSESTVTGGGDEAVLEVGQITAPPEYQNQLQHLISLNKDLFAETDKDLGRTKAVSMKIDTGDNPPIRLRPYRTAINQRRVIDDAVNDMLKNNIIRPSHSEWSFPVVLIEKSDGSKRFCVDFRKLNKITKSYVWPLPHIDDILASMGKKKHFTCLDLKSGYWQVELDPKDRSKTAFACHKGLYEFNVMPFGLCNAPSVFQELMTYVLEGISGEYAIAYLDDIIIYSETEHEHLIHLQNIFDRLRKFGLKLKMSKCEFMKPKINYLGFMVGREGLEVDPNKVEVIQKMAPPTDVRGIRSFIGCVSWYRRFCPKFSEIATPLIALTKKHARFTWTKACQDSFEQLKTMMTEAPILAYPDPSREYILYTDASDQCVGALLAQESDDGEKVIHYLSHKLSDSQKKWPTIQKEGFAIVYALEKLNHYLQGAKFVIRTDHKPLKYLFSAEMKNRKIQMWAIKISAYNCSIEYLEGKKNTRADMLSRLPVSQVDENMPEVGMFNSNVVATRDAKSDNIADMSDVKTDDESALMLPDMEKEQRDDPQLQSLIRDMESGSATKGSLKRYIMMDKLLYYCVEGAEIQLRLMVPKKYQDMVLQQFHESCAHWGPDKTYKLITSKYHWVGLYRDVLSHIDKCVPCKERMLKQHSTPLQEMDKVTYPFQKVGIDTCGPYPTTLQGNRYILTIVDIYSGWPEAFAIPDKSAETIANIILDELIPRHSCPVTIVTDNGTEFKNSVMETLCQNLNIKHIFTSTYHPEGNGKTERFHRVMNDMLSKQASDRLERWDLSLPQVLAAYRVGVSDSTQYAPFFLLYTRDPVLPIDNLLRPRRKYLGDQHHQLALERQHEAFVKVRHNLQQARSKQAFYHDKRARDKEYEVGDPVYLYNNQRQSKLEKRWQSHYRIVTKHSSYTYTIKHQLTGDVRKVHAKHLERANISDWPMPAPRKINDRAAKYVVPPVVSTETEQDSEQTELYTPPVASDSEDNLPLSKLRQRLRDADSYSDTAEMLSDMRSENTVSAIWIEQKKIAKARDTYTRLRDQRKQKRHME